MVYGDHVSDGYEKLRTRRLGLPEGMKAFDTTQLKRKRVSRKRKAWKRDKWTTDELRGS